MTNGVKLSANFVAPEDVTGSMTVEHNGDLNSWTNKADFAYKNSSPMSVYSEFSKTRTSGKVITNTTNESPYQHQVVRFCLLTFIQNYSCFDAHLFIGWR